MTKTGMDIFSEKTGAILQGRNIALVTGSSNINSLGQPVYRVVKQLAGDTLKAIWSLQHGFFVDKQDNMILSGSFQWQTLDIPIYSLYGDNLMPQEEWLEGIDAVLVDIFDIGTRVYTFINHVVKVMQFLSGKGIPVIILDRPNPLNGINLEGNVLDMDYRSIVGELPVPMRHGLTAGEFAGFALSHYQLDLELEVVEVTGWQRKDYFRSTWTYPSPNMPTPATALVYPGAVLLEGTALSEARGTTRPFELMGAPFMDNFAIIEELEKINLPAVRFIPMFFKPEFSKFQGQVCNGLLVSPTHEQEFQSFAVYYEIIRLVRAMYPSEFQWKEPPYEFEYERPPIDMICGSPMIRQAIEKNTTYDELLPTIAAQLDNYLETITPFLLY